jgi:hypothetical protein
MTPYGIVYLTTCLKNGKQYIGQTHYPIVDRYKGSGKAITRAIKRYGNGQFIRETLFEAFTKIDLDWAERFFIAEHNAVASRKYYNISPGGRASLGFTGKKHSLERNVNLSALMMRKHHSAVPVTLDDITYNSVWQAHKATGFSGDKIHKFLKTGIHPKDQTHGGKGLEHPWACGKIWRLESFSGEIIEIHNLVAWCRANNVRPNVRDSRESGKFYDGWRVINCQ